MHSSRRVSLLEFRPVVPVWRQNIVSGRRDESRRLTKVSTLSAPVIWFMKELPIVLHQPIIRAGQFQDNQILAVMALTGDYFRIDHAQLRIRSDAFLETFGTTHAFLETSGTTHAFLETSGTTHAVTPPRGLPDVHQKSARSSFTTVGYSLGEVISTYFPIQRAAIDEHQTIRPLANSRAHVATIRVKSSSLRIALNARRSRLPSRNCLPAVSWASRTNRISAKSAPRARCRGRKSRLFCHSPTDDLPERFDPACATAISEVDLAPHRIAVDSRLTQLSPQALTFSNETGKAPFCFAWRSNSTATVRSSALVLSSSFECSPSLSRSYPPTVTGNMVVRAGTTFTSGTLIAIPPPQPWSRTTTSNRKQERASERASLAQSSPRHIRE
jgi:hypothetical protein